MNPIKKYSLAFAVVLPVLILVLIRSLGSDHFKSDAEKWAEPSISKANMISMDDTGNLPGNRMTINLDKETLNLAGTGNDVINIPAGSLLSKENLKVIRKHDGPVLLFSSDAALAARMWMILSQMGCRNLFLLTRETDNEVLKSKFRPDTLVKPEL